MLFHSLCIRFCVCFFSSRNSSFWLFSYVLQSAFFFKLPLCFCFVCRFLLVSFPSCHAVVDFSFCRAHHEVCFCRLCASNEACYLPFLKLVRCLRPLVATKPTLFFFLESMWNLCTHNLAWAGILWDRHGAGDRPVTVEVSCELPRSRLVVFLHACAAF